MFLKSKNTLFRALGISLACNFLMAAVILYFAFFNPPPLLRFSPLPVKEGISRASFNLEEKLRLFQLMTFDELKEKLYSNLEVELGYQERDLALSSLVEWHQFDIKRATGGFPFQKIRFIYDNDKGIDLFTTLTSTLWSKIISFVEEEVVPFTAEGIYKRMKGDSYSPSLILAFIQTEEFSLVQTLFSRSPCKVHKGTLLRLIYEGKWETISSFIEEQKKNCNFSEEVRQKFLLSYLKQKSATAAHLMLVTDKEFALKKLSDAELFMLLSLLSTQNKDSLTFAKLVVNSQRKEVVRQKAAFLLSQLNPIAAIPSELSNIKNLRPNFRDRSPAAPSPNYHIVQPGETLWIISQKYLTTPEELMLLNHLPSSNIRIGQSLKIP